MHNIRSHLSRGELGFEPNSPIKVVIGYEDFQTGERAMQSCKRLLEQLADQFEFSTKVWKFDILRMPKLRDLAAQDMAEADLVLISAHGRGELPSELRRCLGTLPGRKRCGAKALVALLDRADGSAAEESPAHRYLQE